MNPFLLLGLFFSIVTFSACSDEAPSAGRLDDSFEGLLRIRSAGDSVALGNSGFTAKFSYDYFLSEHEVTRGEYAAVMGGSADSGEENQPVVDVTFYDAVLYANALSKMEKLDTVYIYTGRQFDAEGSCVFLDGFSKNFSAGGYRLPTEAEWVYVASPDFDPSKNAWTSDNSDYLAHDVCTIGKNANGICDMAGNALEWTSDWLSDLEDSTVVDFVGGGGANSLNEVVVKGGSFRNAARNVKLENRGDIYTVTPSMKADYVGFRLAFGKIPDAVFGSSEKKDVESSVSVLTTAKRIREFFGTYKVKLAFRDDETGNVGFVNFMSSLPRAVEIPDTIDSYHPAISPDGRRVAFCTKPEGVSGKSELYVRNLDANGSGLVKLDVESAAVPRWRVVGADTQIVYVTSAGNNSDAAEWKSGSTWAVTFSGGKFGEPQKLFDGTYNGGVSADGRLAVTGARLLRASVGGKEELWFGGEQTCNASLADSSKRTLFLDFGSSAGAEFSGKSYNAHEMLLVADSAGTLSEMIPAPDGHAFDHTEWVCGKEGFAVSTLTGSDGAHAKVALVDVSDSGVTELLEGAELWHPDLWVGKSGASDFELDPDSAGVYLRETDDAYGLKTRRARMEIFWENADSIEVACVGSSHIERGVNPSLLPNFKAVNLGNESSSFLSTKYVAENYVLNHSKNLKVLVISLDLGIWTNTGYFSTAELFLNEPGVVYDRNHDFWKGGVPEDFTEFVKNSFVDESVLDLLKPYNGHYAPEVGNGWGKTPEVSIDSTWASKDTTIVPLQMQRLEELIQKAEESGIHLIGIIFPQSPQYRETGSFGRYGPERSVAKRIVAQLDSLQKVYPKFILMDENKFGDHDYTDEMALDIDHLAEPGAVQLTARLDSLLQTLDLK